MMAALIALEGRIFEGVGEHDHDHQGHPEQGARTALAG
jgi:hypothetical protein